MRVGIIGLGKMGSNHLNEFRKDSSVKKLFLCDVGAKNDNNIYSNLSDFLENKMDVVIIATPTSTHLEVAREVFSAKKSCVLIEKPLGLNVKECKEIKNLAQKYHIKAAVGFSERFNPAILALKKLLANECLISLEIRRFSPYPARISDCGILEDLSVHDLDLLHFLSGEAITNAHILAKNFVYKNRFDEAMITANLGDKMAFIHQSWNASLKKREIIAICKNCVYEADLANFSLKKNNEIVELENLASPLFSEHKALFCLANNDFYGDLADLDSAILVQEVLETK